MFKIKSKKFQNKFHGVSLSYNELGKREFHKDGKSLLRALAKELEWPAGTYDVRSNLAGIACSGEITLHHEKVYIQLSDWFGEKIKFLVRSCKGRKDYTGGANHFVCLDDIDSLPALVKQLESKYVPFLSFC